MGDPVPGTGDRPIILRICKEIWNGQLQKSMSGSYRRDAPEDEFKCFHCGFDNFVGQGHCKQCKTYLDGSSGMAGADSGGVRHIIASTGAKKKKTQENAQKIEKELDRIKQTAARLAESDRVAPVPCQTSAEEAISGVGSMSHIALSKHLISLRIEPIQRLMRPFVAKYMQHPKNAEGMFNRPVDPVAMDLPDYLQRIKYPMDLGTVRSRLQRGIYESLHACTADISQVFKNAMSYNPQAHHVHQAAKIMKTEFEADVAQLEEKFHKDIDRKASHSSSCKLCLGEMCVLCGEKCLRFEPPVLVCHGTCMSRIKKNAIYYVTSDGIMLWCQKCYIGLPAVVMEMPDKQKLLKKNLFKCKSDEEVSEPWVKCDACDGWCHQICGLYNDRYADAEQDVPDRPDHYECPKCKLDLRATSAPAAKAKPMGRPRGRQPKVKAVSPANSMDHISAVSFEPSPLTGGLGPNGYGSRCRGGGGAEGEGSDSDGHDNVHESSAQSVVDKTYWQHEMTNSMSECSRGADDGDGVTDVDGEEGYVGYTSPMDVSTLAAQQNGNYSTRKALSLDSVSEEARSHGVGGKTRRDGDSPVSPRLATSGADLGLYSSVSQQWRAASLPRTKMSNFMEAMVAEQLRAYGFADVVPTISVRMASNTDQHVEVPEPIVENMSTLDGKKVPELLGYRQKCVLLFQNIDGVDVCLFCLYVQEFSENCPDPNKSVVYVSYLDSVDYLRPLEARTLVYHEIMVSYLKWVQMRGFKQAHIWSCPPQRGDNFIFWSHPVNQKTPSRDRLNAWYNDMLLRATKLGVIAEMGNLFSTYFQQYMKKERDESTMRNSARFSFVGAGNVKGKSKGKGASSSGLEVSLSVGSMAKVEEDAKREMVPVCPPVFEGDYWVNECLRVHRSVVNRSRGDDGQDRDVNKRKVREILKSLMSTHNAHVFARPVDEEVQSVEGRIYGDVIKNPMDLGTVREKLRKDAYGNVLDFAAVSGLRLLPLAPFPLSFRHLSPSNLQTHRLTNPLPFASPGRAPGLQQRHSLQPALRSQLVDLRRGRGPGGRLRARAFRPHQWLLRGPGRDQRRRHQARHVCAHGCQFWRQPSRDHSGRLGRFLLLWPAHAAPQFVRLVHRRRLQQRGQRQWL